MSRAIDQLVGLESRAVHYLAEGRSWDFALGDDVHLSVVSPWRIVGPTGIQLGDCDHEQQFGLPNLVDAEATATQLLRGRRILRATLVAGTADLGIEFDGGVRLDVFNQSSGYEGWQLSAGDGLELIALGGGDVAEWGTKSA